MIQLQSDSLFFIGNFTIFTEIETQSFVAPLVTRKSNKLINSQEIDSFMHTLHLVFFCREPRYNRWTSPGRCLPVI